MFGITVVTAAVFISSAVWMTTTGALPAAMAQSVFCNGTSATIVGTPGNDNIVGTPGRDVIAGLGGNDRIQGLAGNDLICGDEGSDRLLGDAGSDILTTVVLTT